MKAGLKSAVRKRRRGRGWLAGGALCGLRSERERGFGGLQGAVVLADVDAIRTEFTGELRVVVEDERNPGSAAERDEFLGDTTDGGEIVAFGAELENIRTTRKQAGGHLFGSGFGGVAEVEDAVEKHGRVGRSGQWSVVSGQWSVVSGQ